MTVTFGLTVFFIISTLIIIGPWTTGNTFPDVLCSIFYEWSRWYSKSFWFFFRKRSLSQNYFDQFSLLRRALVWTEKCFLFGRDTTFPHQAGSVSSISHFRKNFIREGSKSLRSQPRRLSADFIENYIRNPW